MWFSGSREANKKLRSQDDKMGEPSRDAGSPGELLPLTEARPLQHLPASKQEPDEPAADAPLLPVDFQDCDSEALELLEDQAELEEEDDEELDRLADDAAIAFPPDVVSDMLKELRRDGLVAFVKKHLRADFSIQRFLIAVGVLLPKSLRDPDTPRQVLEPIFKTALYRFLQRREKLTQYNTVDDALALLRNSSRTIVLSGAGISVSCGIPDFRSKDGIYARLQESEQYAEDLQDPQDMFDKQMFLYKPELFYAFAREIYPSNFEPSPSHRFIRLLETQGRLLRNYSQNIDTLEQRAGIERVLNCHGSFATASCVTCAYRTAGESIREDIFAQQVPECPLCAKRAKAQSQSHSRKRRANESDEDDDDDDDGMQRTGILKPDITFFGEKLSDNFDHCLLADRGQVSLLVIMGTSLKVAPVSSVVGHLPHTCPVILINRTPVLHVGIDIMLLGDADVVVQWLCKKLGWQLPGGKEADGKDDFEPERLRDRYVGGEVLFDVDSLNLTIHLPFRL